MRTTMEGSAEKIAIIKTRFRGQVTFTDEAPDPPESSEEEKADNLSAQQKAMADEDDDDYGPKFQSKATAKGGKKK